MAESRRHKALPVSCYVRKIKGQTTTTKVLVNPLVFVQAQGRFCVIDKPNFFNLLTSCSIFSSLYAWWE